MTPAELAGGFAMPETMPLAGRIEHGFIRRLESLPADSRQLLLVAAVEPVGDVTLLWRAAERLGLAPAAAAACEAAGLIELGTRVRFRHPLVRSAAYRAADADELREVHRALAEVTDPDLTLLPVALLLRAGADIFAGAFDAASLVDEATTITHEIGVYPLTHVAVALAAWRGRVGRASELIESAIADATAREEGQGITLAEYARALLYNGLGRYENALGAAERSCESEALGLFGWALVELIEAAARCGRRDVGTTALRRLEERTSVAATDWALGTQARSRALLSDGAKAEALYREALERLARDRVVVFFARAQLVYGEWLRREGRRVDARVQLRAAYERFSDMGAEGFTERARRELAATGERVGKRSVGTRDELTAQETQIARLAANGLSNAEIGAQLFISYRTVEWHLKKIFAKLDITSRKQIGEALAAGGRAVSA
jgi:DNA-binding CsgD family transcriptional regulator